VAILEHTKNARRVALSTTCLVGRSALCSLRIADRRVSSEHARLSWDGASWNLKDLGSRNGTYVDGQRLEGGASAGLRRGATIGFGRDDAMWCLADDSAPQVLARHEPTGRWLGGEEGLLVIPSDEAPRAVIFEQAPGCWVAEREGDVERLEDQQILVVDAEPWRVLLPTSPESTWAESSERALDVSAIGLKISVSSDEELVQVSIVSDGQALPMRCHSQQYLLVVLARRRLRDRREGGHSDGEEGWIHVEDLCALLQTNLNKLSVDVFRLRRQFTKAGVAGAKGIIERDLPSRQLRLGVHDLEIMPL